MAISPNGLPAGGFNKDHDIHIMPVLRDIKVLNEAGEIADPEKLVTVVAGMKYVPAPIRIAISKGLLSDTAKNIGSAAYVLWLLNRQSPAMGDLIKLQPIAEARMSYMEILLESESKTTVLADGSRNPEFTKRLQEVALLAANIKQDTLPANLDPAVLRKSVTGRTGGTLQDRAMDRVFAETRGYEPNVNVNEVDLLYRDLWEETFLFLYAINRSQSIDEETAVTGAGEQAHRRSRATWIIYRDGDVVRTMLRGKNSRDLQYNDDVRGELAEMFGEYTHDKGVTSHYTRSQYAREGERFVLDNTVIKEDTVIPSGQLFAPGDYDPDDWLPVTVPGTAGFQFVHRDNSLIYLTSADGNRVRFLPLSTSDPDQYNLKIAYDAAEVHAEEERKEKAGPRIDKMLEIIQWYADNIRLRDNGSSYDSRVDFVESQGLITDENISWANDIEKQIRQYLGDRGPDPLQRPLWGPDPLPRPALKTLIDDTWWGRTRLDLKHNFPYPDMSVLGAKPPWESFPKDAPGRPLGVDVQKALLNSEHKLVTDFTTLQVSPNASREEREAAIATSQRMNYLSDRLLHRGEAEQRSAHKEWLKDRPPAWLARWHEANFDQEPE